MQHNINTAEQGKGMGEANWNKVSIRDKFDYSFSSYVINLCHPNIHMLWFTDHSQNLIRIVSYTYTCILFL